MYQWDLVLLAVDPLCCPRVVMVPLHQWFRYWGQPLVAVIAIIAVVAVGARRCCHFELPLFRVAIPPLLPLLPPYSVCAAVVAAAIVARSDTAVVAATAVITVIATTLITLLCR